ncbi:type VI secretion system protein TssA [Pseudoxanthomonas kalamensis DSM 18571]|uniref:type VI secretion system protein TssA n=1 Tax=Pseudoxanthomonas kalamensis TaxID=289483 RepID=UPI001391D951|nr:type VI secretion system protein TssA [Pseudoxanthomonas kalamensis]KAF1712522.1 type VI secretion system protein TssA [Pseudoxanthomonas kalamensis DSM 18571]
MTEAEDLTGGLLAPISEAQPCGEDLSFSLEYDRIQDARRSDDPTLEQGEWVTDLKAADWPAVLAQTGTLLRKRSKDLQLAVWHCEAAARTQGFRGLAEGYRLVAGLCERYWDALYPPIEDGDSEQRIGNLGWLLANSGAWMKDIPLTRTAQGQFGLIQFETARSRHNHPDNAAQANDGLPPLDVLETARRETPHDYYRELLESIPDCQRALKSLEDVVDARLGLDGPSFAAARDQLQFLHDLVLRSAREAGMLVEGEEATEAADSADADAAPTTGGGNGPLNSRREALAQLRRVAEFFRRTEPHSPVAYLADKAARWGEMPLHVWLKRVIKDDSTLAQVEELLDVDQQNSGWDDNS